LIWIKTPRVETFDDRRLTRLRIRAIATAATLFFVFAPAAEYGGINQNHARRSKRLTVCRT
jgi:hypothetical protein